MILEFTVKNFRSIENQTFDLTASDKVKEFPNNIRNTDNTNVLSSCIIYGRNASGKSNLLNVLEDLKFFISNSSNLKHSEEIVFYQPFEFDTLLKNKPVEFGITFITKDNLKFKYDITFNRNNVLFESLYYFPRNKTAKLFLRDGNKPISYGEYYTGSKKSIEDELLDNQLFLSKSATKNINLLKEAYQFFSEELKTYTLHETNIDYSLINYFASLIFETNDPYFKTNINNLLKASDVNITNFEVNETDYSKVEFSDNLPSQIKDEIISKYSKYPYTIKTYHKLFENVNEIGEAAFNLEYESLGTKRLLIVGGLILKALNNGGTIVIDELDKGLHPLLTRLLIQLFHSPGNNPYNAQLIFASHDSSLLDNDLFRRDQIYFTEKDYTGKTSIYRLSDIKGVRKDVPFDKWYLSGRFNAIPILEDLELKFEPEKRKDRENHARK